MVFGLFPDIRPQITGADGLTEPIGVTPIIEMVMFTVAALILLISKPDMKKVPDSSVFKAGIVSAIALFGLAWLTDTFIGEWETEIVDTVGGWVNDYKSVFFFGVFLVAALTTSQSTATRTIVPIGLAAGLSPALISGMWAGGFAGVFTLPTNGSQIAAANFDETGTTKLGTKLVDHSFIVPVIAARRHHGRMPASGSPASSSDALGRPHPERSVMNDQELLGYVTEVWDRDIIPTLHDYIRIPNVSPVFEEDWESSATCERAVDLLADWSRAGRSPGCTFEIHEIEGLTPVIFMEIPPANGGPADDTVLLYGHLDKQPELFGWREGLGPVGAGDRGRPPVRPRRRRRRLLDVRRR